MKITKSLVKHLISLGLDKKHDDSATYVESDVKSFATDKLLAGELTPTELAKLTIDESETKAKALLAEVVKDTVAGAVQSLREDLFKHLSGGHATKQGEVEVGKGASVMAFAAAGSDGAQTGGDGSVRVKEAVERYSHNRTALLYTKSTNAGNRARFGESPVVLGGDMRPLDEPSQRDKAIAGAWFKHMVNRHCRKHGRNVPGNLVMTDHDKSLVRWAVENSEFIGPINNRDADEEQADMHLRYEKAAGMGGLVTKALLDDSTSGGLEAVPIEFDNQVIMTALLNGELFPLIDWKTTERRRIEGYSMGEFTFAATAEGTAITPFTTTSFIAAFDTNIYPIVGAVEVGLDFLDDAPTDIAGQIQTRYGDGFLKKMDGLVATGAGSTEITGLFTTSGLNNLDASGASLPYATADAEALFFGVAKQYRQEAGTGATSRAVFLSNETVYRRFRAVPWGEENANLRAFGMTHGNYMMMDHPYKINETVTGAKAGFFCLNRFRGYRRSGFQVTIERGGSTNRLKNQELIVVRARYGGQLSLAQAGAIIDDLPTS